MIADVTSKGQPHVITPEKCHLCYYALLLGCCGGCLLRVNDWISCDCRMRPSIQATRPSTGIPSPIPQDTTPATTPPGQTFRLSTVLRYRSLGDRCKSSPGTIPTTRALCAGDVRGLSQRCLQPAPGPLFSQRLPPIQPVLLCRPSAPVLGALSEPGRPSRAGRWAPGAGPFSASALLCSSLPRGQCSATLQRGWKHGGGGSRFCPGVGWGGSRQAALGQAPLFRRLGGSE